MISSSSKHLICSCLGCSLLTTMTRVRRRLMTEMLMTVSSRRMTNTTTTMTMRRLRLRMMIITTGVLLPHLVGGPWLCGNAPLPNVPHRMLRACTQTSMETLVHKLAHQLHTNLHQKTHTCKALAHINFHQSTCTYTCTHTLAQHRAYSQ